MSPTRTKLAPRRSFATRQAIAAHEYGVASAKLEESFRLDPSAGTLLNLARCHEEQGLNATAYGEYLSAERLARTQNKSETATTARARANDLEARLLYVTVRVHAWVSALEVRRDNELLGPSAIGSPIPTDPGPHVLTVSAAGYETWSTTFSPREASSPLVIEVPELHPLAAPPPPPTEPLMVSVAPPPAEHSSTIGYVAGGAGIAALVTGAIASAFALHDYGRAKDLCPTHVQCRDDALSARGHAETKAWVADIAIGAGIVGVAISAYFLFVAPRGERQASRPLVVTW